MATRSKRQRSPPKAAPRPQGGQGPGAQAEEGRRRSRPRPGRGPAGKGTSLVIVESPAKAKTIGKYLGRGYRVQATVGHIMDLPEKKLGIDIENGLRARVRRRSPARRRRSPSSRRPPKDARESSSPPTLIARARRSRGTSPSRSATRGAPTSRACSSTRSPRTRCSARSRTPGEIDEKKVERSRRGACSIGSSATRRARSSGRR